MRDAVETVGILDQLHRRRGAEARAVLDAIPPAFDAAILAALESAFERGVPVALEWVQVDSEPIEVRLSEEPHGDGSGCASASSHPTATRSCPQGAVRGLALLTYGQSMVLVTLAVMDCRSGL